MTIGNDRQDNDKLLYLQHPIPFTIANGVQKQIYKTTTTQNLDTEEMWNETEKKLKW